MAVAKEQIRQIISENNINSVADIYTLLKDSFKDILQELMEAELDATPGYEKNQRVDIVVWMEDNICIYRYGEILHASAVLLKLFMSDRDYMSTGEDLHFLFRVCK